VRLSRGTVLESINRRFVLLLRRLFSTRVADLDHKPRPPQGFLSIAPLALDADEEGVEHEKAEKLEDCAGVRRDFAAEECLEQGRRWASEGVGGWTSWSGSVLLWLLRLWLLSSVMYGTCAIRSGTRSNLGRGQCCLLICTIIHPLPLVWVRTFFILSTRAARDSIILFLSFVRAGHCIVDLFSAVVGIVLLVRVIAA